MMVAAAEIVLAEPPELLGEVTAILTKIGRWGARRNDIAHGVVSHYTSSLTQIGLRVRSINYSLGRVSGVQRCNFIVD